MSTIPLYGNSILVVTDCCPLCDEPTNTLINITEWDGESGVPTIHGLEFECAKEEQHDLAYDYEDMLTFRRNVYEWCIDTIQQSRRWELVLFGESQIPIVDWEEEVVIPQSPYYLKTWEAAYASEAASGI